MGNSISVGVRLYSCVGRGTTPYMYKHNVDILRSKLVVVAEDARLNAAPDEGALGPLAELATGTAYRSRGRPGWQLAEQGTSGVDK